MEHSPCFLLTSESTLRVLTTQVKTKYSQAVSSFSDMSALSPRHQVILSSLNMIDPQVNHSLIHNAPWWQLLNFDEIICFVGTGCVFAGDWCHWSVVSRAP